MADTTTETMFDDVIMDPGDGAIAKRYISVERNGRTIRMLLTLNQMTYGKVRLCIGPEDGMTYDDGYCYESPGEGLVALARWNGIGDPIDGWHRHLGTGRRRTNGDPATEHQAW